MIRALSLVAMLISLFSGLVFPATVKASPGL